MYRGDTAAFGEKALDFFKKTIVYPLCAKKPLPLGRGSSPNDCLN